MNYHSPIADRLTVGSILGCISSWLVNATPVLQALALIASILAACAAIYYHVQRARRP